MGIENSCHFVGRLGADPKTRSTGGQKPMQVANFSIAVNEKIGQRESTLRVNVVCFGKLAEIARDIAQKGMLVGVHGRFQLRTWTDKEGAKRSIMELIADSLKIFESKGDRAPEETTD